MVIRADLRKKLKELEKDYGFNISIEADSIEIMDDNYRTEIYAELNLKDDRCVDELLTLLDKFDFSYVLEFNNCEELINFNKLN